MERNGKEGANCGSAVKNIRAEVTTGENRQRKKAQLYAVSQLAVMPATMLPYHSFSRDSARSSESNKTSRPVRENTENWGKKKKKTHKTSGIRINKLRNMIGFGLRPPAAPKKKLPSPLSEKETHIQISGHTSFFPVSCQFKPFLSVRLHQ